MLVGKLSPRFTQCISFHRFGIRNRNRSSAQPISRPLSPATFISRVPHLLLQKQAEVDARPRREEHLEIPCEVRSAICQPESTDPMSDPQRHGGNLQRLGRRRGGMRQIQGSNGAVPASRRHFFTWVENKESSPNTNTGYQSNIKSCPNIDIPRISNLSGTQRKLHENYILI